MSTSPIDRAVAVLPMAVLRWPGILLAQMTETLRQRRFYARRSLARVLFLRISITNFGRRWRPRVVGVRVRGIPQAINLRSSTSDFRIFVDIVEHGEYGTAASWKLDDHPTIVDLGSNIGLASLYFQTVWPHCKLHCVEPDATNFALLSNNLRHLAATGQLQAITAFAGAKEEMAGIDRTGDSWGFRKVQPASPDAERVPCLTMASLTDRWGLKTIDLLKCDIEGSERELFNDCRAWIHRVNHLIVEVHDKSYHLPELYADLNRNGWHYEITDVKDGYICFLKRVGLE